MPTYLHTHQGIVEFRAHGRQCRVQVLFLERQACRCCHSFRALRRDLQRTDGREFDVKRKVQQHMHKLQKVKTREQERGRREGRTNGGREGGRKRRGEGGEGGEGEGLEGGMTSNGLRKVKRGSRVGGRRQMEETANTSSVP
jgi:hypothetical protein